ncbi:MAG: metallophosphoesterase [Clostridia bacterium]|nr:metallophosphoesterase [Clostridia bacterium]
MKKLILTAALLPLLLACACGLIEAEDDRIAVATLAPSTGVQPVIIETSSLEPTPTSTPAPTPVPEPYEVGEGVYSIAWLSDTQHYSAQFPEIFLSMTEFLSLNCERMRLAYIVFTGDFVHNNEVEDEWKVADEAMRIIDRIPNGVLAGNHDMEPTTGGYEYYDKYFGRERYQDRPYYGGAYLDNHGHYDLINAGETEYIFVYMSHAPDKAAFNWVNETLQSFPDRVAILCLHDYYTSEGTYSDAGEEWFEKVVVPNDNVYMVLCGHRYGIYAREVKLDEGGRTVLEMMMNYQAAGDYGGSGYFRLMQVDEQNGCIKMLTYSPYLDDYNMFDEGFELDERYWMDVDAEEFTVAIPWS